MKLSELDSFAWRKSSYSGGNGDCIEVAWRKSSYSGGDGNCVEVGWRKSSYSGPAGCVEVAAAEASVLLRDSKNAGGPTISVSTGHWRELMQRLA